MKKTLAILAASCLLIDLTQAQTTATTGTGGTSSIAGYRIGEQGADSRVWQKIVRTLDAQGRTILQTNQAYVEMASGLNHLVGGKWVESKEEINILPDGTAAATQGQHQAYFPGDIYRGEIRLVTSDGKQLRSRPLGLSYFDGNKSVLIAELKDSTGWLVSPNQVIYADAFTDFKADLRYTYTKAGFEQDIILREQPPTPESFGLDPETTRLQVLTEFFNPPQPGVTATTVPTDAGNLENDSLSFGAMQVGRGRAFLLGTNSPPQVEVNKQWLQLEGRQFLVEEVPVESIADELSQLPVPQTSSTRPNPPLNVVSTRRLLPAQRLVTVPSKHPMQLAQNAPLSQGLVLDYVTMTSQTNYTFQGDTTYYISGAAYLSGTNTFEGGVVLKYAAGASLNLDGSGLNWLGSAYRPVILTAVDDNSVGDTISGSTGNPTNYYANAPLTFNSDSLITISYFRIAWAAQAVSDFDSPINFYDGQFVNCQVGIASIYSDINLRNVLFANVQSAFETVYGGVDAQNTTFSGSLYLSANLVYGSMSLENCILANVTNLTNSANYYSASFSGDHNGFYNSPEFGTNPVINNFYPFQSVGAGSCYLANGGNFTNVGTTNIDPRLLADLQQKTTYPPMVLTNQTISINTNLNPQAQRDTDTPDLGYHYDPIDYITDLYSVTNATLTVTGGVAIACYNEAGIQLQSGSAMVSVGTPLTPNWFVRYSSVQEQSVALGGTYVPSGQNVRASPLVSQTPNATFRFSKFAASANGGYHLTDGPNPYVGSFGSLLVQDCEFWNGSANLCGYYGTVATLKNNLFARTIISAYAYPNSQLSFSNNLVWGSSSVLLCQFGSPVWYAFNNAFDSSSIVSYSTLSNGYNAYLNCTGRLNPTNANDIVLTNTLAYQTGFLGTFYQPTNSPLIHKGSTNANLVGLYHYTVTTNQVVEGANTVSIGCHYVATGSYGNPLDTDGDGIPDYLEDANGNGWVDSGETDWQSATDLGLKVFITRPRNGSILP
jgi:hypothetical protein